MADRDSAVASTRKAFSPYQKAPEYRLAYLGDGSGNVYTSQANYYLVRYPLASSPAVEMYGGGAAFPPVDGVRLIIGYTIYQPNVYQIISTADARLDAANPVDGAPMPPGGGGYANVQAHAANHMYLNVDPVFINWRQITPLGVFPYSGMTVRIWPGYIPRSGADIFVAETLVDLTSHIPVSGAIYALISFDSTGAVVVTDGAINAGGFSALSFSDIPDTPTGNWRSCAVALYVGQTAVIETRSEIDFLDLRFPEEQSAALPPTGSTTGISTYYQTIDPYSGGLLGNYYLAVNRPALNTLLWAVGGADVDKIYWLTPAGYPGLNAIPAGNWHVTFMLESFSSPSESVYVVINRCNSVGGYLSTILTTATQTVPTSTPAALYTFDGLVGDITLDATDRIQIEVHGWCTAGGSGQLLFQIGGTSGSQFTIPGQGSGNIALTNGHILVGNASNIAEDVAPIFLRLDAANSPITGPLKIQVDDPKIGGVPTEQFTVENPSAVANDWKQANIAFRAHDGSSVQSIGWVGVTAGSFTYGPYANATYLENLSTGGVVILSDDPTYGTVKIFTGGYTSNSFLRLLIDVAGNIRQYFGTFLNKLTGAAGIGLDPNSATGDHQLMLSPSNLTANRRATFQDKDGVVAYLSDAVAMEVLMSDGITPPDPLTTDDETDWLYGA